MFRRFACRLVPRSSLRFDRYRPLCLGDKWVADTLFGGDGGRWWDRRQWNRFMYGEWVPFRNRIPRVPGQPRVIP